MGYKVDKTVITVRVPNGQMPDEWALTAAILELIEQGSSRDCVERTFSGAYNVTTRHHRIGCSIEVAEGF